MKKSLSLLVAVGLLVGAYALPAEAKKKKKKKPVRVERVVEFEYTGPGVGLSTPAASVGYCYQYPVADPCLTVVPLNGEAYVKVEVTDASGTTVAGFLTQGDIDGDGIGDLYGEFCGGHTEFVPLELTTAPVELSLYSGACNDGSPSVMTEGTVKVTLSNMP